MAEPTSPAPQGPTDESLLESLNLSGGRPVRRWPVILAYGLIVVTIVVAVVLSLLVRAGKIAPTGDLSAIHFQEYTGQQTVPDKFPEGFPSNFPVLPGAKLVDSTAGINDDNIITYDLTWQSDMSQSEAVDFYHAELSRLGWLDADYRGSTSLNFTYPHPLMASPGMVVVSTVNGKTQVLVDLILLSRNKP